MAAAILRPSALWPRTPSVGSDFSGVEAARASAASAGPSRPRVRQAMVAAAARISTPDSFSNPRQLIRVDGAPLIIHLLHGLQAAGIERAVLTLGDKATLLAQEVRRADFGAMQVEFVWCDRSWKRGHASNILAARSMFIPHEPLLLVMSDHIFDWKLLRRAVTTPMPPGADALVLLDDSDEIIQWATKDHCAAFCKDGHCGTLVKVAKGDGGFVSRIGKKISSFDGLEAGMYVANATLFDTLHTLLAESIYCTLAEAMQVLAAEGRLAYMPTGDLHWFGELTVSSLPMPVCPFAVKPEWRETALQMLRISSPHLSFAAMRISDVPECSLGGDGSLEHRDTIALGDTIGEGGTSTVMSAERSGDAAERGGARLWDGGFAVGASSAQGLAVKVIRKGQSTTEVVGGDLEKDVMWEVYVLQQLDHAHIVRVMDVIDVVDATYIVMERIDGPELTDFLGMQPGRRLLPEHAAFVFAHLLAALRHAHAHGYLHCDIKPQNVRLNKACDRAVLTDWGYARRPGSRSEHYMCGTPAYASPEQLTGYSCDSVTGRATLGPATDVWSIGVLLFEMVSGFRPFDAEDYETLTRTVLACQFATPNDVPDGVAAAIASMLQLTASDRASVHELCALPWVASSGHLPPDVAPAAPSVLLTCGECVDDEPPTEARCPSFVHRPAARRALLLLLYAALCAVGLWSHLAGPAIETSYYHAT